MLKSIRAGKRVRGGRRVYPQKSNVAAQLFMKSVYGIPSRFRSWVQQDNMLTVKILI